MRVLGELFVFLFFGIVAVSGSYFVQVQRFALGGFRLRGPGRAVGQRDPRGQQRARPGDRPARRQAHAWRCVSGRERTRVLYTAMVAGAFVLVPLPWLLGSMTAWLLLPWLAIPLALPLVRIVRTRVDGPSLNGALAKTGALQLVFCLLFSAGILAERRDRALSGRTAMRMLVRRHTLRLGQA